MYMHEDIIYGDVFLSVYNANAYSVDSLNFNALIIRHLYGHQLQFPLKFGKQAKFSTLFFGRLAYLMAAAYM